MSASSDDSEYKVRGRKRAFSPSQTPKGRATRRSPDKQASTSCTNGSSIPGTNGGTSSRDPVDRSGFEEVDDSGDPTSRTAAARSPELGLFSSMAKTRHASSSLSEHSSKSPTPPSAPLPQTLSRSRQAVDVRQSQTASTSTSPLLSDDDAKPKKRGFAKKKRPAVSSSDESDATQVEVPTPQPRKVGRPRAQPKPPVAAPSRSTSGEDVDPVKNGSAKKSGDEELSPNGSGSEKETSLRVPAQPKPARGRGRPRGKRSFPPSRAVPRPAAASAPNSRSKPNSASASEASGAGGGGVRATRATVTLPAGYIEGVKSTRMTKARSESVPVAPEVEEPKVVEVKGKKAAKGKGKEKEKEKHEDEEKEEEKFEDRSTFEPERTTFSKRRKVDTGAAERAAERAAVRLSLLEQLDQEADLINSETHPLIERTCERLVEEKVHRLANLAHCREQRELVLERHLAAETEAVWRQWADAKDALRMDLYLANHDQLKQLIYEEKAYPFLRDHPLLVSSHNLPPVPYFRAPLSPTLAATYPPRSKILSSEYLEPPPVNPALDHSVWELSSSEIADDLAIFADFAAQPFPFPPPPPPPQHAPIPGYHYPLYAPNHLPAPTAFHPSPPLAAAPPHAHFYSKPTEAPPPDHRLFPSPSTAKPVPATRMNFDIPSRTNFDSTKPVVHPNPYSAFGLPSIASLDGPRRTTGAGGPLDGAMKVGGAGTSLLPAFAPSQDGFRPPVESRPSRERSAVAAAATTGWHSLGGAAAVTKAAPPVGVPAAWGAPTTAPVAPRVVPYPAKPPPTYQYWG